MIGKKVRNPKPGSSKAARVKGLCEYIEEAEHERGEKCTYYNGRGFILTETPEGHRAEMLALARVAVRSADPINHYVLSWKEGEQPTVDQVEQAVDILLRELGLVEHQAVYGLHVDTDNIHLHVAVNRVHPVTERPVRINNGFDKEALHKAVAHIEQVQGWSREQRGRYKINERGEAERSPRPHEREGQRQNRKAPRPERQDVELRKGEMSAERIAIAEATPIIEAAQSWRALHDGLAAHGMRYERKGSGAIVWVGDIAVKASSVAREAGLGRLQKRLGPFQAAVHCNEAVAPTPAVPERLSATTSQQDSSKWRAYAEGRQKHAMAKREGWTLLRERAAKEREQLKREHRQQREKLHAHGWQGKGVALNALRSVLASEQAGQRAAMKEQHAQEREQLREAFPSYPSYEQWLQDLRRAEVREQIEPGRKQRREKLLQQRRAQEAEHGSVVGSVQGNRYVAPDTQDIRDFVARVRGAYVDYHRRQGSGINHRAAFTDRGRRIDIYDGDTAAVRAALQLAAQKWGGQVQVTGDERFIQQCVELAATEGFTLTNPELQGRIQRARASRRHPPRPTQEPQHHATVPPTRSRARRRGR